MTLKCHHLYLYLLLHQVDQLSWRKLIKGFRMFRAVICNILTIENSMEILYLTS
jgi:hypothetical protein